MKRKDYKYSYKITIAEQKSTFMFSYMKTEEKIIPQKEKFFKYLFQMKSSLTIFLPAQSSDEFFEIILFISL